MGGGKGGPVEVDVLEKFYQATKDALIEAKNEVNHILFVQWGADFNLFCRGSRSRRI